MVSGPGGVSVRAARVGPEEFYCLVSDCNMDRNSERLDNSESGKGELMRAGGEANIAVGIPDNKGTLLNNWNSQNTNYSISPQRKPS